MDLGVVTEIFRCAQVGYIALVGLNGPLDRENALAFETEFAQIHHKGVNIVILNMAGISNFESNALSFLINAAHKLHIADGGLYLVDIPENVKTLLNALGLEPPISIFEDYRKVVESLGANPEELTVIKMDELTTIQQQQQEFAPECIDLDELEQENHPEPIVGLDDEATPPRLEPVKSTLEALKDGRLSEPTGVISKDSEKKNGQKTGIDTAQSSLSPASKTFLESAQILSVDKSEEDDDSEMLIVEEEKSETTRDKAKDSRHLKFGFLEKKKESAKVEKPQIIDMEDEVANKTATGKRTKDVKHEKKGKRLEKIGKDLIRRFTVRYFTRMYPYRNFPLMAILSQDAVNKISGEKITQVEGREKIEVEREHPFIKVAPVFPGCLCTPREITLDVTPHESAAKFWITPNTEGELKEARVELWYRDQLISTIDTPTKVTKQSWAKASVAMTFAGPMVSMILDMLQLDMKKGLPLVLVWMKNVMTSLGGSSAVGIGFIIVCAIAATVFYILNRPVEGDPVENLFSV